MTLSKIEQQRHAEEKGKILTILHEQYGNQLTTVRSLVGTMDLMGFPMSRDTVRFALQYLQDRGYIEVRRTRDQPGYRSDREWEGDPNAPVTVGLRADGVLLINGQMPADPAVIF